MDLSADHAELTVIAFTGPETLPLLVAEEQGFFAAELQSPRSVLKPGMPLDPDGIRKVLELRRKYGTPPAALGEPEKYLDLSFYDEAGALSRGRNLN